MHEALRCFVPASKPGYVINIDLEKLDEVINNKHPFGSMAQRREVDITKRLHRYPCICDTCGSVLMHRIHIIKQIMDGEGVYCELPHIISGKCGGSLRMPKSEQEVNAAIHKILIRPTEYK